jgi:hypothetical protein
MMRERERERDGALLIRREVPIMVSGEAAAM